MFFLSKTTVIWFHSSSFKCDEAELMAELTELAKPSTPALARLTVSDAPSPAALANSANLAFAEATASLSLAWALSTAPCSGP